MTRIVLRIDRLRLHGIDASEGEAVARALQDTLAHALRERVDALPSAATVVAALEASASGASRASSAGRGATQVTAGNSPAALGASVAQGIVRGWLP
jgi:hypothetical protein